MAGRNQTIALMLFSTYGKTCLELIFNYLINENYSDITLFRETFTIELLSCTSCTCRVLSIFTRLTVLTSVKTSYLEHLTSLSISAIFSRIPILMDCSDQASEFESD